MSTFGYFSGGQGSFGPSTAFKILPYQNYRSLGTWFEEWIDALANELDVLSSTFISESARANLLDPTAAIVSAPAPYFASQTAAPTTAAAGAPTLLDLLCVIAGVPFPIDTNLTVAQKQAIVVAAQEAFKRKTVRPYLQSLATKITDGVGISWGVPPNCSSIIIGDGEPSPGYGSWVQANSALAEVTRPWTLGAARSVGGRIFPAWGELGIGVSQFRAGYSSAGEMVMPVGARINNLANEHYSSWTLGVADSWTAVGTVAPTQDSAASSLNWEFTTSCAKLDMSAATIGQIGGYSQTSLVNNRATHRLQIDYAYTNAQNVGTMRLRITDVTNTQYYNPDTSTWGTAVYDVVVPPSSTRGRYVCDVVMQRASSTASTLGTASVNVQWAVTCDGTATTQVVYRVYRVGLYEKYDLDTELGFGERTLWLPLIDAPGWSTTSRAAGGNVVLEPANAARTAYKSIAATSVTFPYRAALSRRGFLATSTWTNLIKGSNSFGGGDWTSSNSTNSGTVISPLVGETVASAPQLNATGIGAYWSQGSLGVPTNKSYVAGVWVKKVSTDGNFTDVTLSLISNSTKATTHTLTQAQGWQLLPIVGTFGGGDVNQLEFRIAWGAASSNGQISVASAYCYDVTGKTGVLYPPVCQSAIGATGIVKPTSCSVVTDTPGLNVLHPLTKRPLGSVTLGSFGGVLVPTFDATSQPDGVIFDVAQGAAAQNRIVLRVASGALEIRRWDATGNQWVASLTLTSSATPTAGQSTWLRDQALTVRATWDSNATQISAGNGNALGTKPGSWAPSDNSLSSMTIGNDYAGISQFDGIITEQP